MKKIKILIFLVSFFGLFACKKGDTGPAGAQGATGSANVQYSSWNPLAMQYVSADSSYEQSISAGSLTQAVLDSGVVLTYLKYAPSGGQSVVVNASVYLQEIFSAGAIEIYSGLDYSGFYYRYVIIPGGVKIGRLVGSANDIKKALEAMSYEDVMKLLGKDKSGVDSW
jgi:hypothetical protein